MSARMILGWLLVASPFVGLGVFVLIVGGPRDFVIIFGGSAATIAVLIVGVELIKGALP